MATPAKTLTGIAFKTTAFLHFDYEARRTWRGDTLDGIDYEQQIMLSLRKDVLQLAGLPRDFGSELIEPEDDVEEELG